MNLEYPSRGQLQQTLASIFRDSKRGTPPTAADASLLSQQLHHDEGRGSAAAAATIDHVGRLSLRQVQQHVEALFVVKLSAKMLEAIEEAVQLQLDGLVTRLCLDVGLSSEDAELVIEAERVGAVPSTPHGPSEKRRSSSGASSKSSSQIFPASGCP